MEINSTINFLQDIPVAEQAIDLTDNVAQSPELDFERILSEAVTEEPELFQNACQLMPVSGNELPLVIESNHNEATFLDMLENPEIVPEVLSENEDEKQQDLPFLMTQLLFDIPNDPIVLSEKAIVSMPTVMMPNEQAKGAVLASIEPLMQEELVALPLDEEFITKVADQDFNVLLNESPNIQKQAQVIQLLSDDIDEPKQIDIPFDNISQPLQAEANSTEPKAIEFINALSEHQAQESEVLTPDKPSLLINDLYGSKPNIKTMVLPSSQQVNDEQFASLFEQKLMDNVSVMVRRNENVAQIQIDPPELGKIEITIERNDDKTDIRFVAQVSDTKQLIENTMDRLKIQFEQSGMQLGQVDVNSGNQDQQSMTRSFRTEPQSIVSQEDDVIAQQQSIHLQNNQLLDLYI